MTPKEKIFISFLLSHRMEQRFDILRHLSPHELKLLVEIILNVVHGVITISASDYNILNKNKTSIRKVIQRGLARNTRSRYLLKINHLLPLFVKAYLKHEQGHDTSL